jgi:hypothetical protein
VDELGASDTATASIKVHNVDPEVLSLDDRTILVGDVLELLVVVRDPGKDEYELSIDWGDGTVGSATSHAYELADEYVVTVTASDEDGGSGSTSLTVVASPGAA